MRRHTRIHNTDDNSINYVKSLGFPLMLCICFMLLLVMLYSDWIINVHRTYATTNSLLVHANRRIQYTVFNVCV